MEQRLIDANALKARIQAWKDRLNGFYGTNDDMVITLDKVQKQIIDDMPTVDAVPIDFLKQLADGKRGYYSDFVIEAVRAYKEGERKDDEQG